jgi:O-antigen/teichoic acid export membrane protein
VSRYLVEIVDTTAMVGQFEKAYLWATRAHVLIVPALVRALYPTLVAYYDDRKRFVAAYHLGTVGIASVEVLVAYFLFFNAKVVLVDLLLGPSWTEAVALLQILCLLPIIKPFSRLGGEALKARREDRIWLVIAVVNLSCLVGFGWVLSHRLGSAGVAWAHYLMVGDLIMAWRVYLVCGPRFWRIARDLAFLYLAPLPFFLGVAHFFPLPDWPRFAASAVVAAAVAALFLLRFRGPFRAFFHSEATLP